jgi:hypothetical protein
MILTQKQVPSVYYEHSRDFQLLGRLWDLVLNYIKTNSELLYNLPISDNSDERLLDLMTMTLGFKSKHKYNNQQLKALCSCFIKIIKNKGNITSITDACNTLVAAEGIKEVIYIDTSELTTKNKIILYTPQELSDINLLKDLFDYILPAGLNCEIIKTLKVTKEISTSFSYSDSVKWSVKDSGPIHGSFTSKVVTKIKDGTIINKPFDETGAFVNTTVISSYKEDNNE